MKRTIFLQVTFAIATFSFLMTPNAAVSEAAHATANQIVQKQVRVPKTFGSSRIRDFQVVDDETVIFDVFGYGNLVAKVFPGCNSLRFANRLAVRDRGFELSRGATLILPRHNERCAITSVTRASEDQ